MTRAAESEARRTYNHGCLIAQALDILGDRWTLLILRDLMAGLTRYSEILESCQGMSPNVLSDRLKRLEAEGLIVRHYERALPPKIEYTLTEKGWDIRPILKSLIDWSRTHLSPAADSNVPPLETDFAVRTTSVFAFQPERAEGIEATLVVEIDDESTSNCWTFRVHDGHLHPRRSADPEADVRLCTNTAGFFQFISGQVDPAECGQLDGPPEVARAIQSCFQRT